jgi:4-hydroxybenzoate polyprenyltransferase
MLIAFLKLLRIQNLAIVAATQYAMRYLIIQPFLHLNNFELQLNSFHFLLLVLSTVFITAAGYVINDYFDTRTDRLNKPAKVIIDKEIPRRIAIFWHTVLNIIGVALGIYLSFYIGVPGLAIIFPIASGLLWFYSTNYKRQLIVGNLTVSLLTAAVPLLVILFEMPLLNNAYGAIMISYNASFAYIFIWVAGFAFFAALTTLIREIVKDAEDFEGDNEYGMDTIPIHFGILSAKWIIAGLTSLLLSALYFVLFKFIIFSGASFDIISGIYFLLFLTLPSVLVIYKTFSAKEKGDYHFISQLTKILMLAGIMYSFVVRYIVLHQIV